VYRQVLLNVKLQPGKRGKKQRYLRRGWSALDGSPIEEEEEEEEIKHL
jgi:hypothetical protein